MWPLRKGSKRNHVRHTFPQNLLSLYDFSSKTGEVDVTTDAPAIHKKAALIALRYGAPPFAEPLSCED